MKSSEGAILMRTTPRPSLRHRSTYSVVWWGSVTGGWSLLAVAGYVVSKSVGSAAVPALAMSALLVLVLELRPLVQGARHDPQGVAMSTAFVLAILCLWGMWPAILCISVASVSSDVRRRKEWWRTVFNVGQYSISVAAASLAVKLAGKHASITDPLPSINGLDLTWIASACVAYFVVNHGLVCGVRSYMATFWEMVTDDFVHYAVTTFSVLALAPIIVIVAQGSWVILPLLLIPLLLVYRIAQMSVEREFQSTHDPLTGLPNRKSSQDALARELDEAGKHGLLCGLLLIDLDRFKEINDTLGHHVGDQLLIHFAQRLSAAVRPSDHAARLGGDEFAVIVPDASAEAVRSVAERVHGVLQTPLALEGMLVEIEASIGIAMFPDDAADAVDLLRQADVAMYAAKESQCRIAGYSPEVDRNSADLLPMLGELRQALNDDSLSLHYQPKVSFTDGALIGVEALLRWSHPTRGNVPPDRFIPLAEHSGIMPLLTERVIILSLTQLAAWREIGLDIPVAVNISPTDLASGGLLDLIKWGLREYQISPGCLQLEVTERVTSRNTPELAAMLAALDRLGVPLSLDDFGTGYSSLLRLKDLRVHELKVDRTFVSSIVADPVACGITKTIIDLAHVLGIPAIAEGVETEGEWTLLKELGCDGAQGWLIAPPMPAHLATAWITDHEVAWLHIAESLSRALRPTLKPALRR